MPCLAVALALAWALPEGLRADAPYPTLGPAQVADSPGQPVTQAAFAAADTGPDLSYRPVSSTAALGLRQACWSRLRILDVNDDGWVKRGGGWLDNKQAGYYYKGAAALDALSQLRHGRAHRIQASLWTWVPMPVGAVVLGYAGVIVALFQYGVPNPDGTYNYSQQTIGQKESQDLVVGAALGLALGAALGLPLAYGDAAKARQDNRDAAGSFNRKLLRDLRLQAQPEPGGAKLGVQKSF